MKLASCTVEMLRIAAVCRYALDLPCDDWDEHHWLSCHGEETARGDVSLAQQHSRQNLELASEERHCGFAHGMVDDGMVHQEWTVLASWTAAFSVRLLDCFVAEVKRIAA